MRGYLTEGRQWLERALALDSPTSPTVLARALTAAAGLADVQGDFTRAIILNNEAIPLWRATEDRLGLARALNNLALVFDSTGEFAQASSLYEEALIYFQELGRQSSIATVSSNLGILSYARGNYSWARELHEQALRLRRETKDGQMIAASLVNLATAVSALGDEKEASLARGGTLPLPVARRPRRGGWHPHQSWHHRLASAGPGSSHAPLQ